MTTLTQSEGTNPLAFANVVWRAKWLLLVAVVVAGVATYAWSSSRAERYSATSTLYIESATGTNPLLGASASVQPDRVTRNQAELIVSPAVAARAAELAGLDLSPGDMLDAVKAEPSVGSDFIAVTGEGASAAAAAAIANAFTDAFIDTTRETGRRRLADTLRELQDQLAELPRQGGALAQAQRATLTEQIRDVRLASTFPATPVRQIDAARAPSHPDSPRPKRDALFGAVIALFLALGLALVRDRTDTRIRDLDDVGRAYPYPILTVVPHAPEGSPSAAGVPFVPPVLREPFRTLRTNLQLDAVDRPLRRLLITSAVPGEGKTCTVRNLALTYAEAGVNVVVVEADLRRPTLTAAFGVPDAPLGIVDVMSGRADAEQILIDIPVGGLEELGYSPGTVRLAPSGATPPNPPSLLASERFREFLDRIVDPDDVVLIDTPPLTSVSDAMTIAHLADGVIVIVRVGKTDRRAADIARDQIERVSGVRITGVVANAVEQSQSSYATSYGYGYEETARPPFEGIASEKRQ
jgi:succinoglycan biosynthesis transport protein ExoP